jgi:hypothetical protein
LGRFGEAGSSRLRPLLRGGPSRLRLPQRGNRFAAGAAFGAKLPLLPAAKAAVSDVAAAGLDSRLSPMRTDVFALTEQKQ